MEILQVPFDSQLGRQALALRVAVFVEEQHVPPEEELDHYDSQAAHFVALLDGHVIGTLRIVDYSLDNQRVAKIGRVAVLAPWRKKNVGRKMMVAAIAYAQSQNFPECYLTAQIQVIGFYERFGFQAEGPTFNECNIPHRAMRRKFGVQALA